MKTLLAQKALIVILGPWVAGSVSDPIVVSPGASTRTDFLSLARMQESTLCCMDWLRTAKNQESWLMQQ